MPWQPPAGSLIGWGGNIWDWFSDPLNLSPLYNLILGGILIFAGLLAFKFVPGRVFSFLVGAGLMVAGGLIAIGYWVIL